MNNSMLKSFTLNKKSKNKERKARWFGGESVQGNKGLNFTSSHVFNKNVKKMMMTTTTMKMVRMTMKVTRITMKMKTMIVMITMKIMIG
ncbi:hypothetical protein VIGAN_04191600, partial [Vigna angularis var. angularis]